MSMSPREIAIMRLQRTVTPPSLRGEAPAPQLPPPAAGAPQPKGDKWYDSTAYKAIIWGSSVGSMALSYQRNQSIPWALAHGIIGPVYLAYRGVQAVSDRS
jgi:hypothetical protein